MAVSLLRDPDYIILAGMGMEGHAAFSAFVSLIMAAKDLGNDGRFSEPLDVVASMIRWEVADLNKAIDRIQWCCKENGHRPWLTVTKSGNRIRLRNFKEWNTPSGEWGGKRVGAGRKRLDSSSESSCIQDETPPLKATVKGNGVLTERGVGENTGDGDRFNVRDIFARLKVVVPARMIAGPRACLDELVIAIRDGADADAIVAGAERYYKTPLSRSKYGWGLKAFLHDGHHDDDPSVWAERMVGNGGGGMDMKSTGALETARRQRLEYEQEKANG